MVILWLQSHEVKGMVPALLCLATMVEWKALIDLTQMVMLLSVKGPDDIPSSGVTLTVHVSPLLVALSGTVALVYDVLCPF